MQGQNKLLLSLDGRTVLDHVIDQVKHAPFSEVIAVTGHESVFVEPVFSSRDLRFIRNEAYTSGMHSSIRAGLLALREPADFVAVCLADQPFLRAGDYETLIQAAAAHPGAGLISPLIDGERGQPTLVSMRLRDEILAHPDDDRGAHYLFARHGFIGVDLTEQALPLAFHDVDTPEAFALAKRMWQSQSGSEVTP